VSYGRVESRTDGDYGIVPWGKRLCLGVLTDAKGDGTDKGRGLLGIGERARHTATRRRGRDKSMDNFLDYRKSAGGKRQGEGE